MDRAGEGVRGEVHGSTPSPGGRHPVLCHVLGRGACRRWLQTRPVGTRVWSTGAGSAALCGAACRTCAWGARVLDAPVPQMVEYLVDVLKIIDRSLPEQVIEVPKLTLQDVVPHRAALREPQLAEKLAEVPVPETVILARGKSALGLDWCQVTASGRSYWWQTGTRNTRRRDSPPAQGGN